MPTLRINKTFLFSLALFILSWTLVSETGAGRPGEYELKAAFIFNFTKFISWPEESFSTAESPINFCIAGDNPFGDTLDMFTSRQSRGRGFEIRNIYSPLEEKDNLSKCHLLYISPSERDVFKDILQSLDGPAILTISDISDFAEEGGIIGFKTKGSRIAFAINTGAAKRANLKISSELLKLAEVVSHE